MCIYNLQPTNLTAGTFLNTPLSSPIQKIKRSRSHRAWYKTCYVHNARDRKKKGCVLKKAELTIASVGVCLVPPISTNPVLSGTRSRTLGWAAAAMQCAGLTELGHWSCCGWTVQGKAAPQPSFGITSHLSVGVKQPGDISILWYRRWVAMEAVDAYKWEVFREFIDYTPTLQILAFKRLWIKSTSCCLCSWWIKGFWNTQSQQQLRFFGLYLYAKALGSSFTPLTQHTQVYNYKTHLS